MTTQERPFKAFPVSVIALVFALSLAGIASPARAEDTGESEATVSTPADVDEAEEATPADEEAETPATDESEEASQDETAPEEIAQETDASGDAESEPADEPVANTKKSLKAPAVNAAPQANDAAESISGYLYYYKVAGFYSTTGGAAASDPVRVTINGTDPVGFEEGMQFQKQSIIDGRYTKVGYKVTTDNNPYRWTCIGFIPFPYDPGFGSSWVHDTYLKKYCFDTVEDGEQFVKEQGGVLYGEVPSDELMDKLKGYGNNRGLMVIWSHVMPTLPESKYDYNDPIIDDANPVNWQPTTNGLTTSAEIKSEVISTHGVNTVLYTVTVPEGTDGDVLNINLAEVEVPNGLGLQPGDDVHVKVIVQDKSGRRYTYLKGSGSLGTTLSDNEDPVSIGFERYTISKPNRAISPGSHTTMSLPGGWRIYNVALDELYSATNLSHLDTPDRSDERNQFGDIRIGWALALAGYEYHPDDDLVKEYTGKDNAETAWQGLRDDLLFFERLGYTLGEIEQNGWFGGANDYKNAVKVLTDLTQNCLDDYYLDWMNDRHHKVNEAEGEGPWFTTFKDAPENLLWEMMNGTFNGSMPETNRSVANAIYYSFYEYFYVAAPKQGGDPQGLYTIMRESVQADAADLPSSYDTSLATGNGWDNEFIAQWYEAGAEATEHELGWWHHIEGHANGNSMQDTVFFVSGQFKLVKPVVEVKVLKVWDDQGDKDGIRPTSVTMKLLADGKDAAQNAITLNKGSEWSGGWQRLARYANNGEIAYAVEESAVPSNYKVKVAYNSDDDGNVTATVTNTHTPKEPEEPEKPEEPATPEEPEPDKPTTPEKPEKPSKPTLPTTPGKKTKTPTTKKTPTQATLPKTGDQSFMLVGVIAGLAIATLVAASRLRMAENKRGQR